jgi:hypothetical protein
VLNQFQNVVNFCLINKKLHLFFVKHNLDLKQTSAHLYSFGLDGTQLISKDLVELEVGEWQNNSGKAEVAQTFFSAVDSKQNENDVTPLEYRFDLVFSPDTNLYCLYRFDNSKERLYVDAFVFGKNDELSHKINFSVDDAHVAYGLKLDNLGEVYQLKVSNSNTLAVLKINPENKISAYLTIPSSNTEKVNPQLHIHKNHQAYVAYCDTKAGLLIGVSVAFLDFDKQKVQDSHHFRFEQDFLAKQEELLKNGNHFFELSEIVEYNNKLLLALEQHQIEGMDVHYEPTDTESLRYWHRQMATVKTGNLVLVVFDKELNPLSCLEIPKLQSGAITDGLNTLGHHLVVLNQEAYFIYTKSTNGFVNDQLMVQKLNESATQWIEYRSVFLPKGHLPVVSTVNLLSSKRLFVHTRKGLTGKANYINSYEF